MPLKKMQVLVVDDDVGILRLMRDVLELEGYQVLLASSAEATFEVMAKEAPDLVLLDIRLPDMDGYTICQCIRQFSQLPIIMVTAKGNEEEKVQGLEAGADDYVTKPFSSSELAARIKAVLRRSKLWEEYPEPTLHCGELVVDFARCRISVGGQGVNLTATEYRLLSYLARNAGRVLTSAQILENVWGEEYLGDTHILQVNIGRLRKKLEDEAGNPKYIITRPGIGYTMNKKE